MHERWGIWVIDFNKAEPVCRWLLFAVFSKNWLLSLQWKHVLDRFFGLGLRFGSVSDIMSSGVSERFRFRLDRIRARTFGSQTLLGLPVNIKVFILGKYSTCRENHTEGSNKKWYSLKMSHIFGEDPGRLQVFKSVTTSKYVFFHFFKNAKKHTHDTKNSSSQTLALWIFFILWIRVQTINSYFFRYSKRDLELNWRF